MANTHHPFPTYIILGHMQEVLVLWSLSCDFYDGSIYWPKMMYIGRGVVCFQYRIMYNLDVVPTS